MRTPFSDLLKNPRSPVSLFHHFRNLQMRGAIGRRLSNPTNGFSLASIVKQTPFLIHPTSHFSSSSDGAGRGRGRGSGFPVTGRGQFGINREPENSNEPVGLGRGSSESKSAGGYGHGRGRPIQSDSISPAFSSFVKPDTPSVGRGRGSVGSDPVSPFAAEPHRHQSQQPRFEPQQRSEPAKDEFQGSPVFSNLLDMKDATSSPTPPPVSKPGQTAPPNNMFNALGSEFSHPNQRIVPGSGAGRGKPFVESAPPQNEDNCRIQLPHRIQRPQPPPQNEDNGRIQLPHRIQRPQPPPQNEDNGRIQLPHRIQRPQPLNEDNRRIQRPQPPPQQQHQRPQPHQQQHQKRVQPPKGETPRLQLSPEEAGRRARSQLSVGEAEGSGLRGRGGGRGRGRGRGARGRGRGRSGEGWRDDKKEEEAEQEALSIFVGDSADGEKFAKKMGPEIMNQLAEGYEDICERALPSTAHDALVDAYDTNLMIECEPEYLMPDFGSNPDIDEKPAMSLRECLEKVKPFIVAYEGIKDQEEWEEAIDEVMAQAPLIKEIVDHYSGPDRVTAKKQNEELDRIATTVPQSAPDSVKRFADRAALSLKSNPGWGFDKKYQFMDKLVLEVSQSYK